MTGEINLPEGFGSDKELENRMKEIMEFDYNRGFEAGKQAQLAQDKADCEATVREIFKELDTFVSSNWNGHAYGKVKSKYLGESDANRRP